MFCMPVCDCRYWAIDFATTTEQMLPWAWT